MDCNDARFYLRFRHSGPDDLGPDVVTDLDRHLADCPRCAAEATASRRFDAAVGRAMRDVPVPAGLRAKLVADLSARRGNVLRRKAYRYAAVAASLLLAVGIAAGIFSAARPTLETDTLVQSADEQLDAPAAEQAVRRWLAAEGLPPLPDPFDFALYLTHGTEPVQGRAVPVVVFRHPQGPGYAKVYAFRDTQFKLKDVKGAQASRCQAVVLKERDAATGVTFVAVYTGDRLDPFLRGGPFVRRGSGRMPGAY